MSLLRVFQRQRICQSWRTRRYSTPAPSTVEISTKPSPTDKKSANAAIPPVESSCLPNTVLTGLNYLKGQSPVLALPDEEYPPWLWTILKPKEYPDDGPGGRAERVQRRLENKQRIKDRNFMSTQ